MKTVSLKNYLFFCYLLTGVCYYLFHNYQFNAQITEHINSIKNFVLENEISDFTIWFTLICLPFELFFGRLILGIRNGEQYYVVFLFKHRIVDSK